MSDVQKARELLKQVVAIERDIAFIPEFREQATDAECLGLALASYFEWDTRIIMACISALEDANLHAAAAVLRNATDVYAEIL